MSGERLRLESQIFCLIGEQEVKKCLNKPFYRAQIAVKTDSAGAVIAWSDLALVGLED